MSKKDRQKKLRAKKPNLPDVALRPSRKREPSGRPSRKGTHDDAQRTALQARVRIYGGEDSRQGRKAASAPHMGCQIGMVLEHQCESDEIGKLWAVFCDWCRAEDAYRRHYIGRPERATVANYGAVPEPMEADPDSVPDLRDEDQKARDAVNNWMRWQGYLGKTAKAHHTALEDARLERTALWSDKSPTPRGMMALGALRELREVIDE